MGQTPNLLRIVFTITSRIVGVPTILLTSRIVGECSYSIRSRIIGSVFEHLFTSSAPIQDTPCTNLRRGRPETTTVHICIFRNAACATAQAPRCSQVVQNQRILVQTRPPRPWAVVNKTQPKEEQTREGLPMNRDTPMSYQDPKQAKSTMFKSNLKPIFSRSKTKHWYGVSFLRCHY